MWYTMKRMIYMVFWSWFEVTLVPFITPKCMLCLNMLGALSIYKDTMKDLYSSIEDCEKFSNVGSPLRSIHDAWVRGCLAGKSCRSPTAFAVPCYQFCWKPTNLSTSLRLWHLRYTKSCLKFWWFSWHLESHDSGILGFKNLHHPTIPPHPFADLQPTSLHKHASSQCMLPTYSLQVCTNMHPHPVCCQPTAYKFAQTSRRTFYRPTKTYNLLFRYGKAIILNLKLVS